MQKAILMAAILVFGDLSVEAAIRDCLKQPDSWLSSAVGRKHIDNLLTHQDSQGCWPKNLDTTLKPFAGNRKELKGTFDNGATVNELRILARAYNVTQKARYKTAFLKGLQCILDAQYSNGGWPQAPQPSGGPPHLSPNPPDPTHFPPDPDPGR